MPGFPRGSTSLPSIRPLALSSSESPTNGAAFDLGHLIAMIIIPRPMSTSTPARIGTMPDQTAESKFGKSLPGLGSSPIGQMPSHYAGKAGVDLPHRRGRKSTAANLASHTRPIDRDVVNEGSTLEKFSVEDHLQITATTTLSTGIFCCGAGPNTASSQAP